MAMSQFKLNQLEQARTALSNCNKRIEEQMPKPGQVIGKDWRDWIIAHALQSEAKRRAFFRGASGKRATVEHHPPPSRGYSQISYGRGIINLRSVDRLPGWSSFHEVTQPIMGSKKFFDLTPQSLVAAAQAF
jgi:hypothetical protein